MKLKAGYLILIFAIVFAGVTAVYSASQKDEQTKGDSQKVIIDVSDIGDKIGIVKEETIMPDGKKDMAQKWGKAEIKRLWLNLNELTLIRKRHIS
jgi:hypothetical protein